MEEKRKFVRLDVSVIVRWRKLVEKTSQTISENKNISENGICLIIEEEDLHAGEKLQLELELPTGKIIKSIGEIVWTSPFMIIGNNEGKKFNAGIKFIEITSEDQQELGKFIWESITK